MTLPARVVWTHFWDMNSGGGTKEKVSHIFIEAPETEAKSIFYARFGHNPDRVSCTCCGPDYSISEYDSLDEATEYHRDGQYNKEAMSTDAYAQSGECIVIRAADIKSEERGVPVPEEGYVWR